MTTGGVVLVAVAIAIGLIGILVPLLPGTLLVYGAIAGWAITERTATAWWVLGGVTALLAGGLLMKYLWPARRMRAADVSRRSLAIGALLGLVGFFVVPVAGLVLGFVAGVFLAELAGQRDRGRAWASTAHAIRGVALSVGVELGAALLAAAMWAVAVWTG